MFGYPKWMKIGKENLKIEVTIYCLLFSYIMQNIITLKVLSKCFEITFDVNFPLVQNIKTTTPYKDG